MTRFESQVRLQRGTLPPGAIPLAPSRIYLALVRFYLDKGRAPSMSELAEMCETNKGTVHKYIHELGKLGLVAYTSGLNGTTRPLYFPTTH